MAIFDWKTKFSSSLSEEVTHWGPPGSVGAWRRDNSAPWLDNAWFELSWEHVAPRYDKNGMALLPSAAYTVTFEENMHTPYQTAAGALVGYFVEAKNMGGQDETDAAAAALPPAIVAAFARMAPANVTDPAAQPGAGARAFFANAAMANKLEAIASSPFLRVEGTPDHWRVMDANALKECLAEVVWQPAAGRYDVVQPETTATRAHVWPLLEGGLQGTMPVQSAADVLVAEQAHAIHAAGKLFLDDFFLEEGGDFKALPPLGAGNDGGTVVAGFRVFKETPREWQQILTQTLETTKDGDLRLLSRNTYHPENEVFGWAPAAVLAYHRELATARANRVDQPLGVVAGVQPGWADVVNGKSWGGLGMLSKGAKLHQGIDRVVYDLSLDLKSEGGLRTAVLSHKADAPGAFSGKEIGRLTATSAGEITWQENGETNARVVVNADMSYDDAETACRGVAKSLASAVAEVQHEKRRLEDERKAFETGIDRAQTEVTEGGALSEGARRALTAQAKTLKEAHEKPEQREGITAMLWAKIAFWAQKEQAEKPAAKRGQER